MSRVYQKQPASTVRRAPGAPAPIRPSHSTLGTSTTHGTRAPTRGGIVRPSVPRQENRGSQSLPRNPQRTLQDRTTRVGDGFQMITPLAEKREQIQRQAEAEEREYEAHRESRRMRNIHEVHRLGGGGLSEEEVRRRQADQYRRDKFVHAEKAQQDQMRKKEEEEKVLQAKKQAARLQSIENEKRERNDGLHSNSGANGWTDKAREEDRSKTMDRFLNRLTDKADAAQHSSDDDDDFSAHPPSNSDKLSILRNALPHIDSETLERYLEIYDGNVDMIVDELSS